MDFRFLSFVLFSFSGIVMFVSEKPKEKTCVLSVETKVKRIYIGVNRVANCFMKNV